MHDPGCHWFSVDGAFKTKLAVKGPAKLLNVDEAALKVVGARSTAAWRIGKTLLLGKGTYAITMVGQAPDDNHLKLSSVCGVHGPPSPDPTGSVRLSRSLG